MKVKATGMDDTLKMLEKMTDDIEPMMKQGVYQGAGVVADTLKGELQSLRTNDKAPKTGKRLPYPEDKQALVDKMGIAKITTGDVVSTKVGFSGYYESKSGKQVALPKIANAINAGTSFMEAQPFISRTVKKASKSCVEAMQKQVDDSIKKLGGTRE